MTDRTNDATVGVFLDTENVLEWLKAGGLRRLLRELDGVGVARIRRAYGDWSGGHVGAHQDRLLNLGFELIHTYHPARGKNAADIHMSVDVMDTLWSRPDLQHVVLITGDSDFSPLFRRVRERGRAVIGVGPRSSLSQAVQSWCDRYVYTDLERQDDPDQRADLAAAFAQVQAALEEFSQPVPLGTLKTRVQALDPEFNERRLGFARFLTFLKASGLPLELDGTVWTVTPPRLVDDALGATLQTLDWSPLPSATLGTIYRAAASLGWCDSNTDLYTRLEQDLPDVPPSDVRRARALFHKSGLFEFDGDRRRLRPGLSHDEVADAVDRAFLSRLTDFEPAELLDRPAVRHGLCGDTTTERLTALLHTEAPQPEAPARTS